MSGNDDEWAIVLFATRGLTAFVENALIGIERCGIDTSLVQVVYPLNAESELLNLTKVFGARPRILEELVEVGIGAMPITYHEYGTQEFNHVSKCRLLAIRSILEEGTPLVHADVDVAWLRNPLPYLADVVKHYPWASQTEAYPAFPPTFCMGFFALSAANESHELMNHLIANIGGAPDLHDQDIFNKILGENRKYLASIFPLPEGLFPNGLLYRAVGSDKDLPVVMSERLRPFIFHSNWTAGLDNKRRLLAHVGAWFGSKSAQDGRSVNIGDSIPLFSMADYRVHSTAEVHRGLNLEIITPPQQWSYAVSLSINTAIARSAHPNWEVRVLMNVRVEGGCIGLGLLQASGDLQTSGHEFQIEKIVRSGRKNLYLTLRVPNAVNCGDLIIRNCSEFGASKVSLLSIETRVFKGEAQQE